MAFAILFLVFNCLYSLNDGAKLPSDIGRCKLSDPNAKSCLQENIQDALRKFKDGKPDLGIPPIEPLRITKMVIGQGTGAVDVVQDFENIDLSGVSDTLIQTASVDYDKDKLYFEALLPRLQLIGDYTLDGKVLILPIKGKGRFNVTLENTKVIGNIPFEKYTKRDKTYWKMIDFVVDVSPGRMYYQFDNLFEGDERLGSGINKMLNENWDVIFADVKSGYEKSLGLIFKSIGENLFNRVPLNDIFLDV